MGFFVHMLLYVGFTLLSNVLRARSPAPERQRREFAIQTIDPGRAIPVVWGTVYLNDSNVIWWGNVRVYRTTGNGLYTNVYTDVDLYVVALTIVLCHGPCDPTIKYFWDDQEAFGVTVYNPVTERSRFEANRALSLLAREHLIYSIAYDNPGYSRFSDFYFFYRGTTVQEPIVTEAEYAGEPTPAYKGIAYVFLERVFLGASVQGAPPLKRLAIEVSRRPNQLGVVAGHEIIGADANPACMIYEILTDPKWGMALPSTALDVAAFRAAGEALWAEGSGLSLVMNDQRPGRDQIDEILRHIDGVVFTDPTSGLLTLKLARADYVFASLPVFDKSVVERASLSRPWWSETKNHVRVTYTGPQGTQKVAAETNLANVQLRGGLVPMDVSYPGFTNAETAQRAAARDLKAASYPFARVSIDLNRRAWAMRPNDVFRLTWEPIGVVDLVCRVVRVEPGTLLDGGIHIEALEDSFAANWTGLGPASSSWVDPLQPPKPLGAQRLEEGPYALVGGDHRRVVSVGARGEGLMTGYQVWSDPSGGAAYTKTADGGTMTPIGILLGVMGWTATSLTIGGVLDVGALRSLTAAELAQGLNLLLVDDEWMAWQTIVDNGNGTYTISGVVRGVMDTSPRRHLAGARVWFPTAGKVDVSPADYGSDITVSAKLLSFNARGVLALADTSELRKTTTSRTTRPYVPTAVKLNTLSYPKSLTGELTVSWSHRNRLGAWTYDNAGATASPEASTTYRVKIYGDGGGWGKRWGEVFGGYGKLKHTESGITGTSYTYPQATEEAENGGVMNTYRRVTVEALVSSLVSHQAYDYVIGARGGWGHDWGNDWGV